MEFMNGHHYSKRQGVQLLIGKFLYSTREAMDAPVRIKQIRGELSITDSGSDDEVYIKAWLLDDWKEL